MIINEKYISDIYGCNVKDTIIKNCRTWLYDAQNKGLI